MTDRPDLEAEATMLARRFGREPHWDVLRGDIIHLLHNAFRAGFDHQAGSREALLQLPTLAAAMDGSGP